jgi:hypothetical protein
MLQSTDESITTETQETTDTNARSLWCLSLSLSCERGSIDVLGNFQNNYSLLACLWTLTLVAADSLAILVLVRGRI